MADVYLAVQSAKPGSSLIVLIDAEPSTTGYKIDRAGGVDLGAAVFDKTYSGAVGTQGAKKVGETAENRLSTWTLQAVGTSEDDLQSKLSVIWRLDEELQAYGGTAYWRAWGSSFLMEMEVLDSGAAPAGFDPDLWPKLHIMKVAFGLVTPPYMSGPPMDILDDFSLDTVTRGDYTFDALTSADVSVSSGQLIATGGSSSSERRLIHTRTGYSLGDAQATIAITPAVTATTNIKVGVILLRADANNYAEVYVDDTGANSRLRIDTIAGGSRTNRASTNLAARLAGAKGWIRGRVEGTTIYAEFFLAPPSPMATPTSSTSYQLASGNLNQSVGKTGIVWNPQGFGNQLDDFSVEPYTYWNLTLPLDATRLTPAIVGDAPALMETYITPSGGSAAPIWASFGWWPQIGVGSWSLIWNGDFENTLLAASGWSVAAVANINGAATSIARITTAAKYGTCSGQIVCPATSGTGANFRVFRRFRKGVTYSAQIWVHSAAGTTNVQMKLGNSAANDVATSANTALSTTWQAVVLTWTPSADRDDAHLGIVIAAATATTFEIDGVTFYEGTGAGPTGANQSEGRGGFPPLGLLEAENSTLSAVANANFRSGFGAATSSAGVVVDPSLLTPDDYASNTIAIEVWARVELVAGSSATAVLQATPLSSTSLPSIYAEEFGSAGKTLSFPSAGTHRRFIRVGTLRLPTDAGRYLLQLPGSTSAGTAPSWDYLVFLPANARALSPSGRAGDSTFPSFVSATSEITRRIRSDLSGTLKEPTTGAPESAAPGLGGSLLEVPAGNLELLVKLSSLVPDDPTSNASEEQLAHSATVHFKVTPRWRVGRPS